MTREAYQSAPNGPALAKLLRRSDPEPELDLRPAMDRALRQVRQGADLRKNAHGEELRFALHVIEAAIYGIDDIRALLEEACEVLLAARDAEEIPARALLAERYDELRLSLDPIAEGCEYEGVDLLGRKAKGYDIELGVSAHFSIAPARMTIDAKGLDLPPPKDGFEPVEEVETIIEKLDRALLRVDRAAENYCRDARFLSARLELN